MTESFKVIRTASGCVSSISLIEKLKKSDIYVIGTDCDPLSIGLELSDKSYVVPRGNDEKFIDEMLKICKKEKPDMIISGPEEEIIKFSKNKQKFDELGVILLMPNYESVKVCMDKLQTNKMFRKINIPVPRIFRDISKVHYPCIIKPNSGRGGRDIYIPSDEKELRFYYKKIKNPIIQEFVEGEEYSIDTFSDIDGNVLSVVPRKRLSTESGISVKSVTVYNPKIIEYTRRILEELKLFGPSCIQCIKDKSGTPKFIEVNPRFGGGSILSIESDPSIFENLLKILKKQKAVPSKGFKDENLMLRYYKELFLKK
jgi:carbamoyl-phosphate synthase large subunit